MRLLLDTHAFLWWSEDNTRLGREARGAIENSDEILVSVVSAWEVAIKSALGKIALEVAFERAIEINRFDKLILQFRHVDAVAKLPLHHGDPFDRMLIAQAQVEGLCIVTHDRNFEGYGVSTIWT
ncbi:MAG TPA: type II toxin-antitoxin system VapC family toxin [Longimicrobiaceae bacterium]|nr:type II toxin-antitoxin system VapC family toxin [Longimicrobiaceae bacterium]